MKRIIIIILSFTALTGYSQEYLKNYQSRALGENPNVEAARLRYEAAQKQVEQAGILPDPMGTVGVFIIPVETRVGAQRATFSISQQFPWFGTLSKEKQVALNEAQTVYYQWKEIENELIRDLSIAYNRLYFINKAIDINGEQLDLLSSSEGQLQTAYETGRVSLNRLLMLQVEQEKIRSNIKKLHEERQARLDSFLKLMNYSIDSTEIIFPDSIAMMSLATVEVLRDSLMTSNPRINALKEQKLKWEDKEDLARLMGKPSFTLGLNYIAISPREDMVMEDNGKNALMLPSVGIRLPIYRKRYSAAVDEAELRQQATEASIGSLENDLQNQVYVFLQEYKQAKHDYELNKKLVDLTEKMMRLEETSFTTGGGSFLDLLDFQEDLLEFRLSALKAKLEMNNSIYRINYIVGK